MTKALGLETFCTLTVPKPRALVIINLYNKQTYTKYIIYATTTCLILYVLRCSAILLHLILAEDRILLSNSYSFSK